MGAPFGNSPEEAARVSEKSGSIQKNNFEIEVAPESTTQLSDQQLARMQSPKKRWRKAFFAVGSFFLLIIIFGLYARIKQKNEYGDMRLSGADRKVLEQVDKMLDTENDHPVNSLEVGTQSDSHGVRLVNTVIVEKKEHYHITPFLFPSGRFGYEIGKLTGGSPALFFDGKEVPIRGIVTDFREIDGKFAYLMDDPAKRSTKEELDKRTLVFDGQEMYSLGFVDSDFREIGGRLAYTTFDSPTGRTSLIYDGKEIATVKRGTGLPVYKEINGEIAYTTAGSAPMTETIHYDGQEIEVSGGHVQDIQMIGGKIAYKAGTDLIYGGEKIATHVDSFKDVAGKIAYVVVDQKIERLFHDGKEIVASSDPWFDFTNIGGKLGYMDSHSNLVYDGRELPYTGSILGLREVRGKLAYVKKLDDKRSAWVYEGKEYPFDGSNIGNSGIAEVGWKVVFTTFHPEENFFYDGRKIGSAGRISSFQTNGGYSPVYFFTTNEDKGKTIFSIYKIY